MESSKLIGSVNHLTGFYMNVTFAWYGLIWNIDISMQVKINSNLEERTFYLIPMFLPGFIHSVRPQNFPKNQHILTPDIRTFVKNCLKFITRKYQVLFGMNSRRVVSIKFENNFSERFKRSLFWFSWQYWQLFWMDFQTKVGRFNSWHWELFVKKSLVILTLRARTVI